MPFGCFGLSVPGFDPKQFIYYFGSETDCFPKNDDLDNIPGSQAGLAWLR
jgi:hypothetical protein